MNSNRTKIEKMKILDFGTIPNEETKDKVVAGDLSRSLNQTNPTNAAIKEINLISSKINTSLLRELSDEQRSNLFDELMKTTNPLSIHFKPICTIGDDGTFTLEQWTKDLFPENTHKDIQNFIRTMCELSFSAIFKNNGEYKDDFLSYMHKHFGNDVLTNATTSEKRGQLLNSAAQGLSVSFRNIFAQKAYEQLPISKQQTSAVLTQPPSEAEQLSTLFNALSNSVTGVLESYLQSRFKRIIEANNLKKLSNLEKEHSKAVAEQQKIIDDELKKIKKINPREFEEKIKEIGGKELVNKNVTEWDQKDIDNMSHITQVSGGDIFTKNARLLKALETRDELEKLKTNVLNNKELSTAVKVEQLSDGLTVLALQKECADYQAHLEGVIKKELKSTLNDLQKLLRHYDSLLEKKSGFVHPDHYREIKEVLIPALTKAMTLTDNQEKFSDISKNKKLVEEYGFPKLAVAIEKFGAANQLIRDLEKPIANPQKISTFKNNFDARVKDTFNKDADEPTKKFLKNVGHILASVVTLGAYAGARAIYSHKKNHYAQFWRSPEENLIIKEKQILEDRSGKKNKR